MKKLLAVLLAVFTLLTLAGCNKPQNEVDPNKKSEGTMTYAEYVAAELNTKVVIEGYVQASQSYWNGATMYVVDGEGGYFIYNDGKSEPNISEEDWAKFGFSTGSEKYYGIADKCLKVHVEGYKVEWAGEVEIANAVITIVESNEEYKAEAVEIKNLTEEYDARRDQYIALKDAKVTAEAIYNWDGSGAAGSNSDLYLAVEFNSQAYTVVVESYLAYEGTDLYNQVLALKAGDVVTLEGFLYGYYGPQVHVTKVVK